MAPEAGVAERESGVAPAELPSEPAQFWAVSVESLTTPPPVESEPALKRLGPLPFARGSFPLMGFFTGVYEQVATKAREQLEKSG